MVFLARSAPQQRVASLSDALMYGGRYGPKQGTVYVNSETAMTHSAVWAAIRLRADMMSTTPIEIYRVLNGRRVQMTPPPFFQHPFGPPDETVNSMNLQEWLYASQGDLDRSGNSVGIIHSRDGYGRPREIELVGDKNLSITVQTNVIREVRAYGQAVPLRDVWLETQYRMAGFPLGLSPIMAGTRSIGAALSAQQAAADHWAAGITPSGMLKNTERRQISKTQIDNAKAAFAASIQDRGLFVHGSEWEWTPIKVEGVDGTLIDELRYSVADVGRFMSVPGDLIDAAQAGTSVTYANISQRTLQFLVFHMGPAMVRRETTWTEQLLPPAWKTVYNTDALLRMDPSERTKLQARRLQNRIITNDEARAENDDEPLTAEQLARENEIYGAATTYTQPTDNAAGKVGQTGSA